MKPKFYISFQTYELESTHTHTAPTLKLRQSWLCLILFLFQFSIDVFKHRLNVLFHSADLREERTEAKPTITQEFMVPRPTE